VETSDQLSAYRRVDEQFGPELTAEGLTSSRYELSAINFCTSMNPFPQLVGRRTMINNTMSPAG
jgi:hypothetical protein